MPILKIAVRHDIAYTYSLYEKSEIKKYWEMYKESNIEGIVSNKRYFSCEAGCEDEALVLTALLMREIGNSPANYYYNKEWKKLFMYCYSVETSERVIEMHYDRIIFEFIGRECLKNIASDLNGQALFWNKQAELIKAKPKIPFQQESLSLRSYTPVIGNGAGNWYDFPFRL